MTNMTEVELRCMFFWGANPQPISWLARRRTNLQSLKLLSQHAAKTSHAARLLQTPCRGRLGLTVTWTTVTWTTEPRPGVLSGFMLHASQCGGAWFFPLPLLWYPNHIYIYYIYIIYIYIWLILFNFSKHLPSLPLCLVACSTGEWWSSPRQTPFWSTGSSSGRFPVLRRKVTTCSFLEGNLMDFVPLFNSVFPKGFC